VYKVVAGTIGRLLNPHWLNYVNTEQYERLRRGETQTLAIHSILSPAIVEGFAGVFMTAANFEDTALYQLWSEWNGAEDAPLASQPSFIRDDAFLNSLRFQSHQNGELLTIHYGMEMTNSKEKLKDGVTEADKRTNRDRLIDSAKRLFGDDPVLWQANKSYNGNPFGGNATRLPNVPHGLNDYADYHNIAFLSALHPTPDHYRFLAHHGLDSTAVYNAIYYQAVYQSVMRTALRDPNNRHPIKIFVSDIGAAQYLQSIFAGAKLVRIDSGIDEQATSKHGRHRKWQDNAEKKRHHREQAREQQIQVLNKQLNMILKLPYVNLAGIGVEDGSDTPPKWRDENTIILYGQNGSPLRPGVQGPKTQSDQTHTDVF